MMQQRGGIQSPPEEPFVLVRSGGGGGVTPKTGLLSFILSLAFFSAVFYFVFLHTASVQFLHTYYHRYYTKHFRNPNNNTTTTPTPPDVDVVMKQNSSSSSSSFSFSSSTHLTSNSTTVDIDDDDVVSEPTTLLPPSEYTIDCDTSPNGRLWLNCSGTYQSYVREKLGDECMDLKVLPLIFPEWMDYGGGPGKSLSAIVSMMTIFGIPRPSLPLGTNATLLHQIMVNDETRYNIIWAPIWHIYGDMFQPYLTNHISLQPDEQPSIPITIENPGVRTIAGHHMLVLGPNVKMPGERIEEFQVNKTALVYPSWWAAQFHSYKATKDNWYHGQDTKVKGIPTAINTFYYNPDTYCAKFTDLFIAGNATSMLGKRVFHRQSAPEEISKARCFFYIKMGSPTQLHVRAIALRALHELNVTCDTLTYGSYSEEHFREAGCRSHFLIVSDLTETQGYAFQEFMALGVPLFILGSGIGMERTYLTASYMAKKAGKTWEPPFPLDDDDDITTSTTTGQQEDNRLTKDNGDLNLDASSSNGGGDRFLVNHIKKEFLEFYHQIKIGYYDPRPYVLQNLSIVPVFMQWWSQLCKWANIPVHNSNLVVVADTMWDTLLSDSETTTMLLLQNNQHHLGSSSHHH